MIESHQPEESAPSAEQPEKERQSPWMFLAVTLVLPIVLLVSWAAVFGQ